MQSSQNELNVNSHIAEIISLVVNVENKAIEDTLLQYQETDGLIKLLENEEVTAEINPEVYCKKTGQVVKTWSDQEISYLVQTIGKVRAKEIIKIKSRNQVALHWIFTDDNALENLSNNDPIGYFIYAASALVMPFSPFMQLIGTEQEQHAHDMTTALKARAFNQLSNMPMVDIIRVNELMRRFLSITQSVTAHKHWAIAEIELNTITSSIARLEEFEQGLQETLGNLIRAEVKRGKLKSNMSYQEVMDLQLHYHGHSNFRNQKRLKSMTETEHVAFLLKDFMPDLTPVQVQIKAGNEPEPSGVKLETHKGEMNLQIQPPKEMPLKLSFAQILKRRK